MNQHLTKDIALVVMSCDAYGDVAKHFFDLKSKYMPWWNNSCYYVNEEKGFCYDGVTIIHAGKNHNWNGRFKKALKQMPEKYILYMQEDYFIDEPVHEKDFIDAVNYMKENHIWYYKISNIPKIEHKKGETHVAIPSNKRYGINLQMAIIDREKLLEKLPKKDMSAWEVEVSFLDDVTDNYEYDLDGCVLNTKRIIHICHGVMRGKWTRKAVRFLRRNGYTVDLKNRKVMSVFETWKKSAVGFIRNRFSTKQIRFLKKLLTKMNFNFVSPVK